MHFLRLLILFATAAVVARAEIGDRSEELKHVVVIANQSDPDSLRLAQHYLEKRGIPAANLLALPMPVGESISWRQFIDSIYQPVQDELVRRGWIQAIGSDLRDTLGRKRYSISGHSISYLVICRGVPLKIEEDGTLYTPNPPFTDRPEFKGNRAAVDSELALVVRSGCPINGMVPNPLFNRARSNFLDEGKVVKVGRLDGPTYADAAALVDNALEAERVGLIGRAYVDIGGAHPEGDKWLEETAKEIAALDFDLEVDRSPQTFPISARFDAPVLYFGWYSEHVNGPFVRPGFRFPPGAIALHIHSFSAQTIHSTELNWCGPLVARGVSGTFGNVHEPFLAFTHRPQIIMRALAEGKTLGEAAALSIPTFSWQGVMIGDPLFRPFAVSLADQWARRQELTDRQYAYVVSREINGLIRCGKQDEAVGLARQGLQERPSLVLLWKTAQLLRDAGRAAEAERILDTTFSMAMVERDLLPVAAHVAQFYLERGEPEKALPIFRSLLSRDGLTKDETLALLAPALKAAETAKASDVLGLWRQRLDALEPRAEKRP